MTSSFAPLGCVSLTWARPDSRSKRIPYAASFGTVGEWLHSRSFCRRCCETDAEDFPGAVVSALKLDVRSLVDRFQSESTRSCSKSVITSLATMLVRNLAEVENETLDRRWMRLVLRAKQSVGLSGASDDSGAPAVCLPTITDSMFARSFETLEYRAFTMG